MPATSFTKVTAANFADGIADVADEAADQANSNDFVNTGNTFLIVINASGGNVTPTFGPLTASQYTVNDAITKTPATPVPTLKTGFYGPFPTAIYGPTVTVNWDTDTSITAAVVEVEATPL